MKALRIVKVLKYAVPFALGAYIQKKVDLIRLHEAMKKGDILVVPPDVKLLIDRLKTVDARLKVVDDRLKPVQ